MSLTKATYSMVDGAPVNVLDFGATGDGATDDTAAIQAAINAGQSVYFPAGQYRITDSIKWQNQWLIGAVDNGELSTSSSQTMILADGTFPAFKYFNASGFNAQGGGIKNFNIYFADGAAPTSPTQRPNAIGFYVASTGGYPAFHTIENITVRGGMWAVFDQSASWMGTYLHINSQHNYAGVYKNGGTTHSFVNCYHRGGQAGFHVYNCPGVSFTACAVDLVKTDVSGYYPIYVENSQVSFTGCDFEGNIVNANDTQVVLADGDNSLVRFESCIFLGSSVTAATETYIVKSTNGAKISLANVDFTPTNYAGSTGLFAYLAADNFATVTAENVLLPAVDGGTPATSYATYPTSNGTITVADIITPYSLYARSFFAQKAIVFSATHDFPSVSSGSYTSYDFTVTGALTGDLAIADVEVASPAGLIVTGHVKATDTVTVSIFNLSGAPVDLAPAQVDIRVFAK